MDNGASSYRRFLRGDESAFDELIKTYRESLAFFINRYVDDPMTAEDLAIDTFLELLIHRHRYLGKCSFKTYLFTIGRNKAIDYLRAKKRKTTVSLEDAVPELPTETSPEESIFRDERARLVNDAIETLPHDMRIAIHLIYFEELSYEETARVMKKNRKQVDNLLYRAKNELRSILGKEELP